MRSGGLHSGAMRRGPGSAAALGVYALAAFLIFGLRVALRPGGETYVGTGADPHIFVWDFAWWPHAILHGENPFVTHAIWAPDGLNLTWTTSVPALALLLSPLTLLFGALTSYNIAAVLLPAVAAWTAFLLCRSFLFYAAQAYQSAAIHPPENFVADLLNVVVPTRLEALGTLGLERVARSFSGGNDSERVSYLRGRRSRSPGRPRWPGSRTT